MESDAPDGFEGRLATAYADWAKLISSVAASLQSLCFEQGPQPFKHLEQTCGTRRGVLPDPNRNRGRPMDHLFVRHIVPVVLECQWPKLRSLSLLGFAGCSITDVSLEPRRVEELLEPADLSEVLTRRLSPDIEITLDPDNGNRFEYYEG